MSDNDLRQMSYSMDLSAQTVRALVREGIVSVSDLRDQLHMIKKGEVPNIGPTRLAEIEAFLAKEVGPS